MDTDVMDLFRNKTVKNYRIHWNILEKGFGWR